MRAIMISTPARASSLDVQLGGARDRRGELGHVLALVAVLRRRLAAGAGLDRRPRRWIWPPASLK
jgi:hypothetical protein